MASAAYVALLYSRQVPGIGSDFDQCWIAARALLRGQDPYTAVIQAGWPWPLYYPLPAVLVAVPFTAVPMALARVAFAGLGAGLLAYGITARGWWGLAALASSPLLDALTNVQWSPLLTAAALLPAAGWVLAAKPTIGLPLWSAFPRRASAIGALTLTGVSLLVLPHWPALWLAAGSTASHIRPPIMRPGGFLLLLALLRWRRPEARLLAALACVPHSPALYEALPLFLAASTGREMLMLALLSYVPYGAILLLPAGLPLAEWNAARWPVMLVLLYLPVLLLVLSRPNTGDDPAPAGGAG
jgi:hypothetical protein